MRAIDKIKSWGKKADAYRIVLTPELAAECLSTAQHNRPISEPRVLKYRKIIRDGEWRYTGQGLVFAAGHMIDGQHRCAAVVAEGVSVDIIVVVDANVEAWNWMDQGKSRTGSDMLEVPNRATVAGALGYLRREELGHLSWSGGSGLTPPEHPAMLDKYPAIQEAVTFANTKKDIRLPPSMLAYAVLRARMADREKADAFFAKVAAGTGLQDTDAAYHLRERLLSNFASKSKMERHELLAIVIKAWASHLYGRSMKSLRWRSLESVRADGSMAAAEPYPSWPGAPLVEPEE